MEKSVAIDFTIKMRYQSHGNRKSLKDIGKLYKLSLRKTNTLGGKVIS